ncbi:RNA polymerase sigma factor, sigma-70 family [Desulfocurvibacter africanus PCS]|uniref:RNA polymerase sigma factor, sigma-70 family n=1 Tax=Desulfocurvibacter africanus PCS TaxID=1262666 RepID=M5PTU6_DESAF|nr:RNA polymerase sigma factor [Desulfocurvibacter africanus]EMG37455.1 RNA polymerase sigma factor, sigma-70 family [Desulfocurvibacter africanus PCS]
MSCQLDLRQIYAEYYLRILRYLRRLAGENEAEDLAQNVFVKVGDGLKDFRGEAKLSTWIYRIATNLAIDRIRGLKARQMCQLPNHAEASEDDHLEKTPSVEQQLIRKEMNDCIRELIDRLPESYRVVLALSDLEGFSNAEIAEILGISLDAAKIRLHRARAKLKAEMEKACVFYRDDHNALSCDRKPLHDS